MELELRFIAGANVLLAGRLFQMHRGGKFAAVDSQVIYRTHRQAVKPRLQSQPLWLVPISESPRDGLIYDFFFRNAVRRQLIRGLPDVEFAFHKELEAAEIGIHVGPDVVGGNHRRLHCGERLLKRHSRLRPCIRNPPPPTPFVRRAQDVLVLRNLLHQVVKRSFHCRRWRTAGLLDRHLSGGKPQVERNNIPLARRVLLDYALQVYQLGTEDL